MIKRLSKYYLGILVIGLLCLSNGSCRPNSEPEPHVPDPEFPVEDTITQYPPVEMRDPNTDYAPAFEGQTRTFGIRTHTAIDLTLLNNQLQAPWGIAQLPNGKLLISQKNAGNLVLLSEEGQVEHTIGGLPPVKAAGQGGLLDIFVDHDFAQNRLLYWSYSEEDSTGVHTALARGRLSENEQSLEQIRVLYRALPSYPGSAHFGSRITMDNAGHLYLSTAERYESERRHHAQELDNGLGKVLRLNPDGSLPNDNPFVGQPGVDPFVYSYGHRNVQGLFFDPNHNLLYQSEMGPMGGDEINLIDAGKNYGWPVISYGLEYSGAPVGAGITQQEGMTQPLYYWDPSVSPSGIILYDADYIPEWKGNLIVACLGGQQLLRLRFFNGKVAGEERFFEDKGQRFRDVMQGRDGKVYTITEGGRLYRIDRH